MAGTKFQQPALVCGVEAAALRTSVCVEKDLLVAGRYQSGCELITGSFPLAGPAVDLLLFYVDFSSDGKHKVWVRAGYASLPACSHGAHAFFAGYTLLPVQRRRERTLEAMRTPNANLNASRIREA